MADDTFRTVLPDLKAVDNGDGTYSVAVSIPGMPPLTGLTAGELLVATAATTAAWQNSGVILTAPDISGVVTAAGALTLPALTFAGDNTWSVAQTGVTLTSPTINGTIATTGLTLPAHTLAGAIAAGGQNITALGNITTSGIRFVTHTLDNSNLFFRASTDAAGFGAVMVMYGKNHANTGAIYMSTPNAAGNADSQRLGISGVAGIAVATWANVTHTGIVLSGSLDAAGQYITFLERAAPGAGAANEVRMYAIVDGGALTDMACVFQDGTVDIFAQEVTPLDAPTFSYSSGTEVKTVLRKEHPGLVKIVSAFPDGKEFVLKEIQYHDPKKIAANKGTENPLPDDWIVEDATQRAERLEVERIANLPKDVVLPQAKLAK